MKYGTELRQFTFITLGGVKWGHVAMISNCVKTTSFHISISILGELGVKESWTKLFDVGPLSDIKHPIDLIGAWKKGDILFRNDDKELICLDLTTGAIKKNGVKTAFRGLSSTEDTDMSPRYLYLASVCSEDLVPRKAYGTAFSL
ncbi:hypothetical protein MTR_1g050305 [Medicago truncatula]|uniref:Uncharacterized protein n=1 Tax=Medicago truncatula TaxID=3880 RepID=A0A072VHW9_MEDTR|nr:hypothetical protein MTR_1g050305 [Medicago truncatula]